MWYFSIDRTKFICNTMNSEESPNISFILLTWLNTHRLKYTRQINKLIQMGADCHYCRQSTHLCPYILNMYCKYVDAQEGELPQRVNGLDRIWFVEQLSVRYKGEILCIIYIQRNFSKCLRACDVCRQWAWYKMHGGDFSAGLIYSSLDFDHRSMKMGPWMPTDVITLLSAFF